MLARPGLRSTMDTYSDLSRVRRGTRALPYELEELGVALESSHSCVRLELIRVSGHSGEQ